MLDQIVPLIKELEMVRKSGVTMCLSCKIDRQIQYCNKKLYNMHSILFNGSSEVCRDKELKTKKVRLFMVPVYWSTRT